MASAQIRRPKVISGEREREILLDWFHSIHTKCSTSICFYLLQNIGIYVTYSCHFMIGLLMVGTLQFVPQMKGKRLKKGGKKDSWYN